MHRVRGRKTNSVNVSQGHTVAAHTVRDEFSHTVNRVMNKGERIFVSRHGRHVVAMVPMEDVALLEALEDQLDVAAATAALAESDQRIPYAVARRRLGLK